MIEIEKPQIECVETPGDASYGKYVIEPLERGYGTTLGNALRRILLSSLPGTAATSIKIAGVQHEFSTIPGVKEDVTEIVLNVKNLLTKLHCEGTKTVFIEAAGPCEVTAGDIKPDGEVEVLNPELQPIYLGTDQIYGGNQGTIYYDEGGLIGQLGVFLFEDTGALERNGEGLFVGAQGTAAQDAEVLNGYLERSNTDIVKQMTEMITYQRALQSAAQVSKMYDQLMTKAATEIGRM